MKPIVLYRATRWPFTLSTAQHLDRVQRRMIRLALRIKFLTTETQEGYARRAARVVANIQRERGPWSVLWSEKVITWSAHILRNRHGCSWGANILDVRSTTEVATRRALNGNRPQTRLVPGFCPRRWTDGVSAAMHFWNSELDSEIRKYACYQSSTCYIWKHRTRVQESFELVTKQLHDM